MSRLFPRIKLVRCNISPTGLIFLNFFDETNANNVFNNWEHHYFGSGGKGDGTKIIFFRKKENNTLVLKNINTNFLEGDLLNTIKDQYPSTQSVNFFMKDNKKLNICKISFSNSSDMDAALKNGVFIDALFVCPERYIATKSPTRCFKCQKIGHISSFCKSKFNNCGQCGAQGHTHSECHSDVHKCVNCSGSHKSNDINCPVWLKAFEQLNFL